MLYIATVDVKVTRYMQDDEETWVETLPVEAEDVNDAYDILDKYYESKTEAYHTYYSYSVRNLQPTISRQSLEEENGSGWDWPPGAPGA